MEDIIRAIYSIQNSYFVDSLAKVDCLVNTHCDIDNVFKRICISCNVVKGHFEVPSVLLYDTLNTIYISIKNGNNLDFTLVHYLSITACRSNVKSFGSFIKATKLGHFSSSIVNSPFGTFYVGKGIILDDKLNVLLYAAVDCCIDRNKLIIERYKLYISPSVFNNKKNIFNKNIISKLIPAALNTLVHNIDYGDILVIKASPAVQVIIEDRNDVIIHPNINESYTTDMNSVLSDNLSSILEILYGNQ